MDNNIGSTRFRHRKSTYTERFLGAFSQAPRPGNPNNTSNAAASAVELSEDDVFWVGDYAAEPNHHPTSPSYTSSTPRQHVKELSQPESCGILAALPENEASSSHRSLSHFYHKMSISSSSSSSSSSSRMILSIPRPPSERIQAPISSSPLRFQSAPRNVPILSNAMRTHSRSDLENDDDDEEGDGEMLPPHEIVARSYVRSPTLSCSVLEGAGRTLKGRDLRQVRNAVFRRTGFID